MQPLRLLLAFLLALSSSACLADGSSLFYAHTGVDGSGDVGLNGANFVLVADGTVTGGVYHAGTNPPIPVVVGTTALVFDFTGQKVLLAKLAEPRDRIELELGDPVPPEWQAVVLQAIPADRLALLQSRGVLVFSPGDVPPILE